MFGQILTSYQLLLAARQHQHQLLLAHGHWWRLCTIGREERDTFKNGFSMQLWGLKIDMFFTQYGYPKRPIKMN